MTTHSSTLAWRIPWTEEPGGLQSIGSQSQTLLKQLSMHAPRALNILKMNTEGLTLRAWNIHHHMKSPGKKIQLAFPS